MRRIAYVQVDAYDREKIKPFAESCVRNQAAIWMQLRQVFADRRQVLEIASGTGQHAVYFGQRLPQANWHSSELPENIAGIQAWLDEAHLPNTPAPIALNINDATWPTVSVDAVFNANTVHIVSWQSVEKLFAGIAQMLQPGGVVCLYGPFNYAGAYTSDSNAQFDAWLKARDPASGIRDVEAMVQLACSHGLMLQQDIAMPANNRLLVWVN